MKKFDYNINGWNKFLTRLNEAKKSTETSEKKEAKIVLPKFRISEAWGKEGSDDRKLVQYFFKNIRGNTLANKVDSVNGFMAKAASVEFLQKKKIKPETAFSYLLFLDVMATLVDPDTFNSSIAGFLFESFLSVILGGRQVPTKEGDISDIEIGGIGYSLKLYTPKSFSGDGIKGSWPDLLKTLEQRDKIGYIVAIKEQSKEGKLNINFHEISIGRGGDVELALKPTKNGGYIFSSKTKENIKNGIIVVNGTRFKIPKNVVVPDYMTASLEMPSREELGSLAEQILGYIENYVTGMITNLAALTDNIDKYLVGNGKNKTYALEAEKNANEIIKNVKGHSSENE